MDVKQIILNNKKNKVSEQSDTLLTISLENSEKNVPSGNIDAKFNQYKQYIKEKDASANYRFNFTINPLCSNVLFNHITEIVKNEGSSGTTFIKSSNKTAVTSDSYYGYECYKHNGGDGYNPYVNRYKMIKDTGYSHPECGNMEYHCGIDIFNNHYFRGIENNFINVKVATGVTDEFNSLSDYARESDGSDIKCPISYSTVQKNSHLYTKTNSVGFYGDNGSIERNLQENNGWFGFNNITKLPIKNYVSGGTCVSINKVINNKESNTFVDLYPDRTLFSFSPKINKFRKRVENNWDYCLTYPYAMTYEHDMIKNPMNNFNGLFGEFTDEFGAKVKDISTILDDSNALSRRIYIRTFIKNQFKVGDKIRICLMVNDRGNGSIKNTFCITCSTDVKVIEKGLSSYYHNNYIGINSEEIASTLFNYTASTNELVGCYVAKVVDGKPCKYYIRKFKRIPNFFGSKVNQSNGLTDAEIDAYKLVNFNSNLTKLGFSKNIYSDKICQINFNDDVNILNLKDNLGRDLSEIFLTIVKNNRGYKEWYENNNYTSDTITFSHCFGNVTSGFDMPEFTFSDTPKQYYYLKNIKQYNISNAHRLHNIDMSKTAFSNTTQYFCTPDKALESGITISGVSNNGIFYGDICELDEANLIETRLDFIRHRFNTAQREAMNNEYSSLTIDTLEVDDYEGTFKITTGNIAKSGITYYHANLSPEGYYYQPHYPIKIKEYSDVVNEGYHTRMEIVGITSFTQYYEIQTKEIHYIEKDDILYVYNNDVKSFVQVSEIHPIDLHKFRVYNNGVSITQNSVMYKPNILKPSSAYELEDGTGKYVWRDMLSTEELPTDSDIYDTIFTNGSIYVHKDINFYLRRQDPYGNYEMINFGSCPDYMKEIEVLGNEKDVSYADYLENGETTIC